MTDKETILNCINEVLKSINEHLANDKGALHINDFSDDYNLSLSFKGTCKTCEKNNKYLKYVIKEMIEEAINGIKITVQFS